MQIKGDNGSSIVPRQIVALLLAAQKMYVVLDKLFFDTNQIVRQRAARYMKLFCKGFQKLRFAWDADFEQIHS